MTELPPRLVPCGCGCGAGQDQRCDQCGACPSMGHGSGCPARNAAVLEPAHGRHAPTDTPTTNEDTA